MPSSGAAWRRKAILVLGMHRSGTSALTRVINLLGADLPQQTIQANQDNLRGYWEPPEFWSLHDQILASSGSRWDDWEPFSHASQSELGGTSIEQRLLDLLERDFGASTHFVVKDPRMCRFVPFWLRLLDRFSAEPHAIIPVRHPFEVAQSLETRDGFSSAKSHLLWLRHVVEAEHATRCIRRSFVQYEQFLGDWRSEVCRLSEELGITWPHKLADIEGAVDTFLSDGLRHHVAARGDLDVRPEVVAWIRRAYAAVESLIQSGDSEGSRRELDQVRMEFDNACLAFGDVLRTERRNFAHETFANLGFVPAKSLDLQVERVNSRLSLLERSRQEDDDRGKARDAALQQLESTLEQQRQEVAAVRQRTEQGWEQMGQLQATVAGQGGQAQQLRATVARQGEQTQQLQATVADLGRQSRELQASVAEQSRQSQQLNEASRRSAAAIAALEAAVALQATERSVAGKQLDVQGAQIKRLQQCLDGAVARIDYLTTQLEVTRNRSLRQRLRLGVRKLGPVLKPAERAVRRIRDGVLSLVRLRWLRKSLDKLRTRRIKKEVSSSGLFCAAWYLQEYRDVADTGVDPLAHYLRHGVREGRCPNHLFHTRWYLEQYPEVAASGQNPLIHYLRHGAAEGKDPSPLFHTSEYVQQHPELQNAKQNPLARYLEMAGQPDADGASPAGGDQSLQSSRPFSEERVDRPCPAEAEIERRRQTRQLQYTPLLSIVVPVYNTSASLLQKMIDSVERQIYENWELCLVDDKSTEQQVRPTLEAAASRDSRIRVIFRETNGNISTATNDGIASARGEFIGFLDHDDELTEDALLEVVLALNQEPVADVIYTDQDKIDVRGERSEPFYKPSWSPSYFRSVMYVGHLLVARSSLLREVGGCDREFDGVQDFELMLRLSEQTDRIRHVPRVLYHWRTSPGSIAADLSAKPGIAQLQQKAVQAHLERMQLPATAISLGDRHRVHVAPHPRPDGPLISVLIPTKDHPELIGPCLQTLFEKTAYGHLEVIVGDNDTTDAEALGILDRYPVTRVPLQGAFHFAAFNNRMNEFARGEYLLLLNNDTEVIQPDWIEHLLLYAQQDGAGAVGPMLLYEDRTVQHAGVILGPRGTADHLMRGFSENADGYAGSLQAAREVSAVTAACLLVRREHYVACGGLNESFARHYEDLDFCLRLRQRGLRNICVGSAKMLHRESKSRGSYYDFTDRVLLLDHWEQWVMKGDPYYNPHFDPQRVDYSLRVA